MSDDEDFLIESRPSLDEVTVSNELPKPNRRITVELPIFLVMVGMALSGTAISNIVLYRACEHSFDYTKQECKIFLSLDKNNHTELEQEVQKYVTVIGTCKGVMEAVVPAILSLFLGVWSDTYGRKPLIEWPLFGMSMSSLLLGFYCIFDSLGPWWTIVTAIPQSLCGGFAILFAGALTYVNDITTPENRTIRIFLIETAVGTGTVIGSLLSAPVLRLVGNTWLIVIASACHVAAYAFTKICIPESLTRALQGGISTVLDFSLVKVMARECFKKRPNNGRAQFLLLLLADGLSVLILYGQTPLEYMYTRGKLHWTLSDFTVFSAINTLITSIGACLGIIVFQKIFRMGDLLLSNIAFVSSLFECIVRILAVYTWHMYLGATIGLFKGLSVALIKSFLTKIMPVTDIAKVFALLSAIEGLCPLIAPLMYNSLYWFTITTFPGAIYVLSSGIIGICIVCLTVTQYFRWNVSSQYQPLETNIQAEELGAENTLGAL